MTLITTAIISLIVGIYIGYKITSEAYVKELKNFVDDYFKDRK